jgi:hypothetical protein
MFSVRSFAVVVVVGGALAASGCENKSEAATPAPATAEPAKPASAPAAAAASRVELSDKTIPLLAKAPEAPNARAGVRKLVDAYLAMKDAYVAKDVAAMKKGANAVASAAQTVPTEELEGEAKAAWEAQLKIITASTLAITAEEADLKTMRLQLAPLSEASYAAARSFGLDKVFVQYCPMANSGAGGYWLAAEDAIKNPYYGDEMLECGEVREVM